ncbi:hypothetical protein [Actinocorallia aurantiaca]|uniref:Uncharacterized protein n=1 Tax=Actinocorallia aurantiaca TaxID=46204 RepID=A0ABN3UWE9_9ACTN
MSLYDLVDRITTVTTIPFTFIGFSIAIWQIVKSRRAAEAAQRAAISTQKRLARSGLLVLIPQLQRAEEELEKAIAQNSKEFAIVWLTTWRWQAGQLRGHLKIASPADRKLLKLIQESVTSAAIAKNELVGSSANNLVTKTKKVREAIAGVTNELGSLMALQGMEIESGQDG